MRRRLAAILPDSGYMTFVAEFEGEVVGVIGVGVNYYYEKNGIYGRLLVLVVDEKWRGRGIGASLVAEAERGLKEREVSSMLLNWSHVPLEISRRWVHTAGLAWLGAMAVMAWQTAMGRSILEPSCMVLLVSLLMLVWLLCAVRAVISCGCDGLQRYLARSRASSLDRGLETCEIGMQRRA